MYNNGDCCIPPNVDCSTLSISIQLSPYIVLLLVALFRGEGGRIGQLLFPMAKSDFLTIFCLFFFCFFFVNVSSYRVDSRLGNFFFFHALLTSSDDLGGDSTVILYSIYSPLVATGTRLDCWRAGRPAKLSRPESSQTIWIKTSL